MSVPMAEGGRTVEPPHTLIVHPWEGDATEDFEIEHPPGCPTELHTETELDGTQHGWMQHTCLVEQIAYDEGLGLYFRHAEDPDPANPYAQIVAPGRHRIVAWSHCYPATPVTGGPEWDTGLDLELED